VQVNRVVDAEKVGRDDCADAAAGPTGGLVIVNVVPELARVVRVVSPGPLVDDFVVGVAGADQDDGRTPISLPDFATGEGVAEDRHQLSVGRDDRRPEIGARDPPAIGAPRTGQVDDLAIEQRDGGDRTVTGSQALTGAPAY
jgi:hypothetical protein